LTELLICYCGQKPTVGKLITTYITKSEKKKGIRMKRHKGKGEEREK
jgi:hypothetical protein